MVLVLSRSGWTTCTAVAMSHRLVDVGTEAGGVTTVAAVKMWVCAVATTLHRSPPHRLRQLRLLPLAIHQVAVHQAAMLRQFLCRRNRIAQQALVGVASVLARPRL